VNLSKYFSKDTTLIAPGLIACDKFSESEIFGATVWLWTRSDVHKKFPVGLLTNLLFSPISNKQFLLVLKHRQPIAYLSWAYFDEDTEYRYIHESTLTMNRGDWNCGKRMWLTDLITPFGHAAAIQRLLKQDLFADYCVRYLYHRAKERGNRIIASRGANVSLQEFIAWDKSFPIRQAT
jgi:cytolysin-activating lysine-acyltransferase